MHICSYCRAAPAVGVVETHYHDGTTCDSQLACESCGVSQEYTNEGMYSEMSMWDLPRESVFHMGAGYIEEWESNQRKLAARARFYRMCEDDHILAAISDSRRRGSPDGKLWTMPNGRVGTLRQVDESGYTIDQCEVYCLRAEIDQKERERGDYIALICGYEV